MVVIVWFDFGGGFDALCAVLFVILCCCLDLCTGCEFGCCGGVVAALFSVLFCCVAVDCCLFA